MDGKKHFKNCCQELNVDCQQLFQLGTQEKLSAKRFTHRFSRFTRTASQCFAVCYFEAEDIYIAWSLREKYAKHKEVFSLKKEDATLAGDFQILPVTKWINQVGQDKETVYVFRPNMVTNFLQKYIKEAQKDENTTV